MNDEDLIVIISWVICGIICAAVASSKGRSGIGWFLIGLIAGCFGIIAVLVVSDLKAQRAEIDRIDREKTRLSDQLAQERLKSEVFREHAKTRLDYHDKVLDTNTRLSSELSQPPLLPSHEDSPIKQIAPPPLPNEKQWYYSIDNAKKIGPVSLDELCDVIKYSDNSIANTLVWKEGFSNWMPAKSIADIRNNID